VEIKDSRVKKMSASVEGLGGARVSDPHIISLLPGYGISCLSSKLFDLEV